MGVNELDLAMRPNKFGAVTVSDIVCSGESFRHLYIGSSAGVTQVAMHRTSFRNCHIGPGDLVISSNVEMIDVVFDSLVLRKPFRISSEAHLSNVRLSGKWKGEVIIVPSKGLREEIVMRERRAEMEVLLDVTELDCDGITIVGLELARVKYRQGHLVPVDLSSNPEGDLPVCFQTMVSYVKRMNASQGLFSWPERGKDRAEVENYIASRRG